MFGKAFAREGVQGRCLPGQHVGWGQSVVYGIVVQLRLLFCGLHTGQHPGKQPASAARQHIAGAAHRKLRHIVGAEQCWRVSLPYEACRSFKNNYATAEAAQALKRALPVGLNIRCGTAQQGCRFAGVGRQDILSGYAVEQPFTSAAVCRAWRRGLIRH